MIRQQSLRTLILRLIREERGATTVEMAVIFLPLMILVLTIFEIGIAYHFTLTAQKSAQLGARYLAARDPLHSGMPTENDVHYQYGSYLDLCYQGSTSDKDACLDPGGPWVCDGASLAGACNVARFNELMDEMQRLYPSVRDDDVTVSYVYHRLGYAGGPFLPEIRVTIKARPSPLQVLSFLDVFVTKEDDPVRPDVTVNVKAEEDWDTLVLRSVTASVFAEDMSSDN